MKKSLLPVICLAAALEWTSSSPRAAETRRAAANLAKLPPPSSRTNVTYASDIKPIFDQSCVKCHGEHRPKARLRLDTLKGALKGSGNGKVIKPGHSAQSVLVWNIAHAGDPDDYMPPPGNKAGIKALSKEQISLIRAWIDQGAK